MDESAEPARRPDPAPVDLDRLEALEQQVRQLTSRLAGWVEAQLVLSLEERRNDMQALRTELQVALNQQLAGARAEGASVLSVATRRLDLAQAQLSERLDARLTAMQEQVEALVRGAGDDTGLEPRVRAAMSRLSESVEARLGQVTTSRQAELDGLRGDLVAEIDARDASTASKAATTIAVVQDRLTEVATRLSDRLDGLARQVGAVAGGMAKATADTEAGTSRADAIEQRARSVMDRLAESLDTRLTESVTSQQAAIDELRSRLDVLARESGSAGAGVTALQASVEAAASRTEGLEQQVKAALTRLSDSVDARLAEAGRAPDVGALRTELQEHFATQLGAARAEVATAVDGAHRRFLLAVESLDDALRTDGRRIEALELHTRRTDERLTELVDVKLAERAADLEIIRGEQRVALDAHLAETRDEVAAALGRGWDVGAAEAARLHERQTALDEQAAKAVASLDALGASVEDALRDAEARLAETVQAKLAELEPVVAEGAEARKATASLSRKVGRSQEQVQATIVGLTEKVDALAAAGMLAPIRSDLRRLQEQVAELAGVVEELQSRRKAPAAKAAKKAVPVRAAAKSRRPPQ